LKTPAITYLGLGSNEGKKFDYLQNAVYAVHKKIGRILLISPVYTTPAWGFEGNPFLNACIKVETYFGPETLLHKLQAIEHSYGRVRKTGGYANRTLDLDILLYEDTILQTPKLQVPHPRIAERRFVLQPLADIADEVTLPKTRKTISELLAKTSDKSDIRRTSKALDRPSTLLPPINFLAIEGNIGAGKTSLAQMISHDFNAKLITERYKDNPFLPKFYKNRSRYAFPLEMSFLADRYQQMLEDTAQFDLFNDFAVSDYDVYKSLIFARVTLQEEEKQLYKKLFGIMYKNLPKPDLYVYLYQNTERLLQNIKKRGRSYEQSIPPDYLESIQKGYLEFIKNQHFFKVKIIDISELDFVARREDYLYLLETISAFYGRDSHKSPKT